MVTSGAETKTRIHMPKRLLIESGDLLQTLSLTLSPYVKPMSPQEGVDCCTAGSAGGEPQVFGAFRLLGFRV